MKSIISGNTASGRLSQTAIIYVTGMLCMELLILYFVYCFWQKAETEREVFQHASKFTAEVNDLSNLLVSTSQALEQYAHLQDPLAGDRYNHLTVEVGRQIDQLKASSDQKLTREKLQQFEEMWKRDAPALNSYKLSVEASSDSNPALWRTEILPMFNALRTKLPEISANVKDGADAAQPQNEAKNKLALQVVLVCGVILNIAIALFVVRQFIAGLTRRIDVLTENAISLGSGKPLAKRIGGNDEIAHLDLVFHTMAREITESAEILQASEERVKLLIANMPVGLVTVSKKGVIQSLNPRTEKIFSYSQSELAHKPLGMLFADESAMADPDGFLKLIGSGKGRELNGRRKDGSEFPAEIIANEFRAQEEDLLLITVQDVSDRHEVERLKREFMAMVSHDLRSPLTSVQGILELLLAGRLGQLSASGQSMVGNAESEITRLCKLVNDLLDVARLESGKLPVALETVALDDVISRSVTSLENYARHNGIVLEHSKTAAEVKADADRITQVLVNLLTNAIKFSPSDSTVTVTTSQRHDNDEFVEVRVTDRGRGIPADHLEGVFKRFHQVESKDATEKRGTGLGLPICKAIIEEHGGAIGVESVVGQGTTFWFTLQKA